MSIFISFLLKSLIVRRFMFIALIAALGSPLIAATLVISLVISSSSSARYCYMFDSVNWVVSLYTIPEAILVPKEATLNLWTIYSTMSWMSMNSSLESFIWTWASLIDLRSYAARSLMFYTRVFFCCSFIFLTSSYLLISWSSFPFMSVRWSFSWPSSSTYL